MLDLAFAINHCIYSFPSPTPSSILDRSGGIVYRTGVFDPTEFSTIVDEAASLTLSEETTSSVAQNRLGVALSPQHKTVQLLQDETNSLTKLVRKVTGRNSYVLANHVPIEIRSYEKAGACMAWHVDDVLYDPPQIEVVYTVENTSQGQTTLWKIDGTIECSQDTDRNSALLLKAGVTPHCVTSLKRGKRVILKCAYVDPSATWLGNATDFRQQFTTSKRTRKKGNKKR